MPFFGICVVDDNFNYALSSSEGEIEIPWYNFKNMSRLEIFQVITKSRKVVLYNNEDEELKGIRNSIKDDLTFFKNITKGNIVIMGTKTAMSLPHKYLKERINIILSHNPPKELLEVEENASSGMMDGKGSVKILHSYLELFIYLSENKLFSKNIYVISPFIIRFLFNRELLKSVYVTQFNFEIRETYKPELERLSLEDIFYLKHPEYDFYIREDLLSDEFKKSDFYRICEYTYRNKSEENILNLIDEIMTKGKKKKMRAGKSKVHEEATSSSDMESDGSIALYVFNEKNLVFNIHEIDKGCYVLPVITHRQSSVKAIMSELMWILRGETDTSKLFVNVWKENTTREFLDKRKLYDLKEGDIGATYGHQMRHYGQIYNKRDREILKYAVNNYNDHCCSEDSSVIDKYNHDGEEFGSCYMNGIDQLQDLIKDIKENPFSTRLIIDLWNPMQKGSMSLPACVYCYNFDIEPDENGKPYLLNLKVIQRSSDILLAGGWNITSACLFLILLSEFVKLTPGKVIWSPSNVHIYENNWEIAKQILKDNSEKIGMDESLITIKTPYPIIRIKNVPEQFDQFKFEDIEIYNYENNGKVEVKMNA